MRYIFFIFVTAYALAVVLGIFGCDDSTTSPAPGTFTLQGTLVLDDGGDIYQATITIHPISEDASISQMLTEYPAAGFSPCELMFYDPLTQVPSYSSNPDVNGDFHFDELQQGTYVVSAEMPGYACPEPALVTLEDNLNLDTLKLSTLEEVSGNLGTTTWSSGKAYLFTGDVMVLPGEVLTIEQGVQILSGGDYSLTITGSLQLDASPLHPVRFGLSESHFLSGGDWEGIQFENPTSASVISGAVFRGASTALKITGGEVNVSECLFDASSLGGVNFQGGSLGIVECCIVRDGTNGFVANNSDPEFTNNVILRMSEAGIRSVSYTEVDINHNIILDCQTGIFADWYTAPTIKYNLISGGAYAIDAQFYFTGDIQFNEIRQQSDEGIYLHERYCYPSIQNNNFSDMPQTILHVWGGAGMQSDTIYAPYNYWDGEDEDGIPSRIIDGQDYNQPNNPISPVEYHPFFLNKITEAGP